MTDLFNPTPDNPQELAYRAQLTQQWNADLSTLANQGRTPAWIESDNLLDKDEAAILIHIADNQGAYWLGSDMRALADALGFVTVANIKASVGKVLDRKLVDVTLVDGRGRLNLTHYGSFVLDMFEMDKEDTE